MTVRREENLVLDAVGENRKWSYVVVRSFVFNVVVILSFQFCSF